MIWTKWMYKMFTAEKSRNLSTFWSYVVCHFMGIHDMFVNHYMPQRKPSKLDNNIYSIYKYMYIVHFCTCTNQEPLSNFKRHRCHWNRFNERSSFNVKIVILDPHNSKFWLRLKLTSDNIKTKWDKHMERHDCLKDNVIDSCCACYILCRWLVILCCLHIMMSCTSSILCRWIVILCCHRVMMSCACSILCHWVVGLCCIHIMMSCACSILCRWVVILCCHHVMMRCACSILCR